MNGVTCPRCASVTIVKNGHAHTGKQRFLCRACTFQFTFDHARPRISDDTEPSSTVC
ncbi:IS1/IS1595 family N-terminal zinc-binding domain-containing protein [Deinococcus yavapaiensis]|uniref:IS1/IS1595 family N-terminal zinc-binding domain-containing protein n=1 Tax=Deinococcus yavapaiensis TaxID=309889 RepID=UPI000DA202D3